MWTWLLFLLALLVLGLVAYLIWREWYSRPRLVHMLLPPYEIPDVILIGGVMVENRGHVPAPNVRVNIQFDQDASAKIHHLSVQSTEPYILRGGGERHNFAAIRLRELRPRRQVFVYWAAADRFQPQVTVTFYRPSGRLKLYPAAWVQRLGSLLDRGKRSLALLFKGRLTNR